MKDLLLQQGIDRSQLTVRCFNESREQLTRLFCEVGLVIMLSRTGGFGLAPGGGTAIYGLYRYVPL